MSSSFDDLVEGGADSVLLYGYEPSKGTVAGMAYDSRTSTTQGDFQLIAAVEEAVRCAYPLAVAKGEQALYEYLQEHRAEREKYRR